MQNGHDGKIIFCITNLVDAPCAAMKTLLAILGVDVPADTIAIPILKGHPSGNRWTSLCQPARYPKDQDPMEVLFFWGPDLIVIVKLAYLEGWKAVSLANDVFGFDGWSSEVLKMDTDFADEDERGYISLGISCIVRVLLRDGSFHDVPLMTNEYIYATWQCVYLCTSFSYPPFGILLEGRRIWIFREPKVQGGGIRKGSFSMNVIFTGMRRHERRLSPTQQSGR